MDSTRSEDLLRNSEFVYLAKMEVPAKNLLTKYAPDRSVRWLQDVCKAARESDDDLVNAPVLKTSEPVLDYNDTQTYDVSATDRYIARQSDIYNPLQSNNIPKWAEVLVGEKCFKVPTLSLPSQTKWWRLEGDYALLSDVHIPFYHAPTLERLMTDSDKVGVHELVIMGDLFDFNQFNHRRGSQYQRRAQEDVEAARPVLKALTECFKTIYVFMGNHDEWLRDSLRNHFDSDFMFGSFFKEMPSVKWSRYGQADVVSGGVKWKLIHGTAFSAANPLGSAKKYATTFNCNVVLGHQHRAEDGYSDGGYRCVCLGGAYDQDKMGYLHHQPYSAGSPKRSVGILKDGQVLHIKDV